MPAELRPIPPLIDRKRPTRVRRDARARGDAAAHHHLRHAAPGQSPCLAVAGRPRAVRAFARIRSGARHNPIAHLPGVAWYACVRRQCPLVDEGVNRSGHVWNVFGSSPKRRNGVPSFICLSARGDSKARPGSVSQTDHRVYIGLVNRRSTHGSARRAGIARPNVVNRLQPSGDAQFPHGGIFGAGNFLALKTELRRDFL